MIPQKRTTRPPRTVNTCAHSAWNTLPDGRAAVSSQPRTVTLSPAPMNLRGSNFLMSSAVGMLANQRAISALPRTEQV
jgi:hypothetical protein